MAVQANVEVNFRLSFCTPSANTTQQVSQTVKTTGHTSWPVRMNVRKFSSSAYLTGAQIVEVHWDNNGFGGAIGYGHGNVMETTGRQGFDFTFSCSQPFLPSEGNELYPARWKKEDTRLVITETEIGNPKKHNYCELKVTKVPFTYEIRNTTIYTAPLR